MMFIAFIVVGGIGTMRPLNTAGQYVIVIFTYIIVVAFNFGLGPLAYTIAREMAVGRNQNKIMSVSIVIFFVTTWVISFTAPYLYTSARLGPMLGFVYAGTTILSLL
jgi:antibiotic biosynthesis monooxygenase (ABM) superfamily enzyme